MPRAARLAPLFVAATTLSVALAPPAYAQTPAGPADEAPWSEEQAEAQRRQRSTVVRDEMPGVDDEDRTTSSSDDDEEYYDPRESERKRHTKGGGSSTRAVAIGFTVAGIAVGLGGAAVGIAGAASEDKGTVIAGAVIGLTGAALTATGVILNLTASASSAAGQPTFSVGIGPTSGFVMGTF